MKQLGLKGSGHAMCSSVYMDACEWWFPPTHALSGCLLLHEANMCLPSPVGLLFSLSVPSSCLRLVFVLTPCVCSPSMHPSLQHCGWRCCATGSTAVPFLQSDLTNEAFTAQPRNAFWAHCSRKYYQV